MTANTFALEDDIASDIASEAALARNADNLTSGTVADTRIASTIARDSEVTAAVGAEAALARNADNLTSGTVAIARLPIDPDVATLSLPASTTISAFGASLIDDAAASNARTTLGLGTAATSNTGDFDAAGAAAAAQAASQPLDGDLTTLAGLTATTDNMIQSVAGAWASRTPTQVKTALSLNNVDNTSDANKPVSTAQQTALNLKANLASPTFTGTVVLPSSQILTSPVLNTGVSGTAIDTDATMAANSDTILASQKATKTALDLKAPLASPTFSGVPKIGSPSYLGSALGIAGTIGAEESTGGGHLGLIFVGTGFGLGAKLDLRRVNGSFAVPAVVALGDVIGGWHNGGCTTNTTTPPVLADVSQIFNVATEDFTTTALGNEWQFWNIPNGSTTKQQALTIGQDASLTALGNIITTTGVVIGSVDSTTALAGGILRARRSRSSGAINNADVLGYVQFQGNDGAFASGATIGATATQAWTGSAHGTKLVFNVVANGATALTAAVTIDQDTSVTLAGALTVSGTTNVQALNAVGIVHFGSAAQVVIGTAGNYTTSANITTTGTGSLTVAGNVGFHGVAAVGQSTTAAAAPAGGTGQAAGAWSSAANRDTAIALINAMRTCLRDHGLMA